MKKPVLIILGITLLININIFAQGTAGTKAKYEYRSLIDMPTAGILEKGFVGLTTDVMPNGVLISKIEVGVFDNISFGLSYGGSNLIGEGKINWYDLPGVNFRVRLLDESLTIPALSVGFDSQGKGEYFSDENRYEIKSPGFYGAVSKNFEFLGFLSLHGTINYSLENKDGDGFLNMFLGFEKTIGKSFSLVGEYNFALNDNNTSKFGGGDGYLSLGFRWVLGSGFTAGFDLRDLLKNKKFVASSGDRALKIEYIQSIF